ncbi:hypothetical protein KGF54_005634 [Candida jiufengensis]|uniref:uncharacterized protein n=1 Tax=Candida jiufengensis TaxID=497108 RepID=UPI002224DACB|nr:uncharacterized protein KGF54_005634 [Candida jiufengensis]KAI5949399.1 hypothetical protein KGF54_005634 [Candida jiufengensis]
MDYDEDELDYNSQDELDQFDEDKLTNEEYELLHDILPQLKSKLKNYNDDISDFDLKEALYYNYFELDPSIEEIKSKFKSINQKLMSKLAQLAKQRALQREKELQNNNSQSESQDSILPSKPQSKLAALAKARSSNQSLQSNVSNTSILDQFLSNPSSSTVTTEQPRSSILKFKRKNIDSKEKSPSSVPLSTETEKPTTTPKTEQSEPHISFDISLDDSIILNTPKDNVSIFWFQNTENDLKRRRLENSIYDSITNIPSEKINKTKESFNKPSPDDEILNAQKQAFDGVGKLSIKEETIEPTSQSITQSQSKNKVKDSKPFKKLDINDELTINPNNNKPHKSFVVIGHVDAGKSTLMGRLLFDYGIVDAKTVNKLVKESEKIGKGSFALAWIMDQTEEERNHGVTVDICATDFEVKSNRFTAIDAPGHKDFVPQMIGGVSNADFALLVIDSITGEFEAGFALDGQTKEHTILAKNLGIEKICVVVNKMDKEDWNENRFDAIKTQMLEFLTSDDIDFKPEQITFIPISGLTGNNVVKRDNSIESFKWYTGPTLGQYLETVPIEKNSNNLLDEPFYFSVHDVYKDKGELKVIGKITNGVIQAGETVIAYPSEEALQVQSIKSGQNLVDFAISGDLVTLLFKVNQLSNESIDSIRIGDILTKTNSQIKTTKNFTASLHLFNMDKPLLVGMPFVLFRNSSQVPARITKIIDITNSTKKKKKILHLTSKQTAIVEIEIDGSLPLTTYEDNSKLGRIVIRREGQTIGAGKVTNI